MIRTFRVFIIDDLPKMTQVQAEDRLRRARLSNFARSAQKPLARILSDLAKNLTDERIGDLASRPHRWEMVLSGKWPARTLTVAVGPTPLFPVRVALWLRRSSPWLVVFEASRGLADAAARLVAGALCGDPSKIKPLVPGIPHWKALAEWVEGPGAESGALLGGRFYHAMAGGTPVEWIALRCAIGSDRALVKESFQTATGIGELLFQTPPLESYRKSLICRVSRLGVIRVYGEEISDAAIDAVILELEALWGFLK